jgi:hypothetical protein
MIFMTASCWRDKETTTSPGVRDDVKILSFIFAKKVRLELMNKFFYENEEERYRGRGKRRRRARERKRKQKGKYC